MNTRAEKELDRVADEISKKEIDAEIKQLDKEIGEVLPTVVETAISETVKNRISPYVKKEITKEIIIRLNDKANALGIAYIQKKVLRFRGTLLKRAMELANGIRILKVEKGQPVIYEKPPSEGMIKHLMSYIDGSKPLAIVKGSKKEPSDLEDFLSAKSKETTEE